MSSLVGGPPLVRLRCATALALSAPGVSVRVRAGDDVVVEAMRPPLPVAAHQVVPLCWMRATAADLQARARIDGSVGDADWFDPAIVRIDLGLRRGATMLPMGVLRVEGPGRWLHLVPVAGDIEAIRDATAAVVTEEPVSEGVGDQVQLHSARDLEVGVLSLRTVASESASEVAATVLRAAAMRHAVDHLERGLNQTLDDGALDEWLARGR